MLHGPQKGAQHSRYKTLGATNDNLSNAYASGEPMSHNLSADNARSWQHLFQAVSKARPWNNGAPRREYAI